MATFLVSPQLELPGVETKAGFYHRTRRELEIEAAWLQHEFEKSFVAIPHIDLDEDVGKKVRVWSDGEDSRWIIV